MAIVAVPGATSVSEAFSRVNGFIAGCGQAGVLVISHIVQGTPVSTGELTEVIKHSVSEGQTVSSGGATTLNQLQAIAADQGVQTQQVDWQQALRSYTGKLPIEIGVSNAAALGPENAGVRGHYIDVLGLDTATRKFLVADPNTQAAKSGGLVEYSFDQIAAANPFGAIIPTAATHAQTLSTATQANEANAIQQLLAFMNPTAANIRPAFGPISTPVQQTAQDIGPATINVAFSGIQQAVQTAKGAAIRTGFIVVGAVLLLILVVMLLIGPPDAQSATVTRRQIARTAGRTAFRAVAK